MCMDIWIYVYIFVHKSSYTFQTHRTLMKFSWIPQVKILRGLAPIPSLQHLFMSLSFCFTEPLTHWPAQASQHHQRKRQRHSAT